MVKQTKNYKKGCVSKKALSAILAASMVMTSSSFVMAAPVEVEDVAVESVAEVQAIDVEEETVGTDLGIDESNVTVADVTYTGRALEPAVTITNKDGSSISDGYTLTYSNNVHAGTGKVLIQFNGENAGTPDIEKEFTISPMELTEANTTVTYKANQGFVYTGKKQMPEVASVSVKPTGEAAITLSPDDYKVVASTKADGTEYDLTSAGEQKIKLGSVDNKDFVVKADEKIGEETYSIDKNAFNSSTITVTSKPVSYEKVGVPADLEVVSSTGAKLTENTDYTIKYFDDETGAELTSGQYPSSMGTHKIQIISAGTNYTDGTIDATYEIVAGTLAMAAEGAGLTGTTVDNETGECYFTYNHNGQVPSGVENVGNLVEGTDYKVELPEAENCKEVGTYEVKLVGLNNYAGQTATVKFAIRPLRIEKTNDTTLASPFSYTATLGRTHSGSYASNATLLITETYTEDTEQKTKVLEVGKDYTYTTDTTKGVVVITGMGNYTTVNPDDDKETTISVKYTKQDALDINDASISATVSGTYSYTGTQIRPESSAITVVENSNPSYTLVNGVDYTITYGENVNTGKGTVIITGKSRYAGSRTIEFDISGVKVSDVFKFAPMNDVSLSETKTQVPTVLYKSTNATVPTSAYEAPQYYFDGKKISTSDLELVDKAGTVTVEIKGKGQYEGTMSTTYKILGNALSGAAKIEAIPDQTYTGSAITPEVKLVSVGATSRIFTKDKDYTVTYKGNVEVGEAYVIVEGIGQYSGQMVASFKIVGTDISKAVVSAENVAYNGEAQTPEVTVKLGDKTLTADDYTVEYKDNTNVGKATITVTGKGGFSGTATGSFEITKADQKLSIPDFQVKALKARNTNANEYTLEVSGAVEGLTFTSSNEAIATVTDKGQILFKHKVGEATITVEAAGSDNANAGKVEIAVKVIPATPTVKVAAANNAFKVTASKVKDAGGYQVAYATKSDFSNQTKKAFNTTSKLSKTIKGKDKTKYNVKVRAYKKVNGKYVFGKWSKVQVVKTK